MPGTVIARLNQAAVKAVQSKDVQARLAAEGAEPVGSTPEQFGEYPKREIEKYAKLVRQIKLQVE